MKMYGRWLAAGLFGTLAQWVLNLFMIEEE